MGVRGQGLTDFLQTLSQVGKGTLFFVQAVIQLVRDQRQDGREGVGKLDHLLHSFALGAEVATSPAKILEQWATAGFPLPDQNFRYEAVDAKGNALRPIPYKEIDLNTSCESFDLKHELTDKGIKRFVDDYKSTLKSA